MEEIIKLMPKNLEDLTNSNILPSIKTKLHGQEIIDTINKENL